MITQHQRWEFGCVEWVEYAAGLGAALFEQSDLDLKRYEWGFSEEYTHIPERLLAGRDAAGYHLLISDGRVSGGPSLPDECLALPGFHACIDWALIAHSSYYPFNTEGMQQRATDHAALRADLEVAGISFVWNAPGFGEVAEVEDGTTRPRCPICRSGDHERQHCPVWPPGVGEVLATNKDKTKRLQRSPELEGLPETGWGVPVFSQMTDEQKARFTALLSY